MTDTAPSGEGFTPQLLSPEFQNDPYPTYAWLREHAPIFESPEWGGVLLTRYADVIAGFRDPRLSSNRAAAYAGMLPPPVKEQLQPLLRNLAGWLLFLDPPAHTRVRALFNRAFVPRLIEARKPRIAALVEELVAGLLQQGSGAIDVVSGLAVPLPVLVIGEMMGLPDSDRELLKHWSEALVAFIGAGRPSLEMAKSATQAILEMEGYFRDIIADRRKSPREDLVSALVHAEGEGELLNEQEMLSTLTATLFGGHETTTNLIENAIALLGQHPDAQAALRAHPERMPAAIEEILRFDAPVQRQGRIAGEDLELGGHPIKKGQRIFLVMAAANRDGSHFANADSFDITRADNRHLSLGHGSHYCIGAALGRLETSLTLACLLRRLPVLRLDPGTPPERLVNATIRGFKSLHIERA